VCVCVLHKQGISAAQPLSQHCLSRSSSKGASSLEHPPSANDTIREDGTRLLGGKYEVGLRTQHSLHSKCPALFCYFIIIIVILDDVNEVGLRTQHLLHSKSPALFVILISLLFWTTCMR